MAIIDPKGLFLGERLSQCSDIAQLHWPRLYAAANGYARLELNYKKIVASAYSSFQNPPSQTQLFGWIREYRDEYLLFVYQSNGALWGQWQTNERYLPGYKTADDKRSPSPPADQQQTYRKTYEALKKQRVLKNQQFADLLEVAPSCSELSKVIAIGVGVGEGVGVGVGEKTEPSGSCEAGASEPVPKVRPEEFANAWNQLRGSLPRVRDFPDGRRRKVQARIRQGITLESFSEAVRLCSTLPFLLGTNRNGWVASFDWLIENDRNISKVLEGNYNESVLNGTPGKEKYESRNDRIERETLALLDAETH